MPLGHYMVDLNTGEGRRRCAGEGVLLFVINSGDEDKSHVGTEELEAAQRGSAWRGEGAICNKRKRTHYQNSTHNMQPAMTFLTNLL